MNLCVSLNPSQKKRRILGKRTVQFRKCGRYVNAQAFSLVLFQGPTHMVTLILTWSVTTNTSTKCKMLLKMNISFLFADNEHQMHFFFNVSYVGQFEKILQAEFHLFKLKPRIPPGMTLPRNVHLIEVWNMYVCIKSLRQ